MKTPNPKADAAREFKARWIAYGMNLFNRAEEYGVDWRNMPMEMLSGAVIQAEEFARPEAPRRLRNFEELFPIHS